MEVNREDIYQKYFSDTATEEELSLLRQWGDLEKLKQIRTETESWSLEPAKTSYSDLQARLGKRKKQAKIIQLYKRIALAAGLPLLFALGYFMYSIFFAQITYETNYGETKTVKLPDGTQIVLAGHSSVSYHTWNWENKRSVHLSGKAQFDVTKKGNFDVLFEKGKVSVTGTSFEVLAGEDYQSVKCFSGSVDVVLGDKQYGLTQGSGADSWNGSFTVEKQHSKDDKAYTTFENVKLAELIELLKLQYGLTFENTSPYINRKLSGRFTNYDENKALQMVFTPLDIKYTKTGKSVILQ